MMKKPKSVDDYIAQYPPDVQAKLKQVRAAIRKVAPKGVESISYGIAGYKLNGRVLIYFSGQKSHIGIYPRPQTLKKELANYASGAGTIRLPLDEPLPIGLITKVVRARMKENEAKEAKKKK
jgi:uncharacterized protein YdhG (YjbR/CyaY superfamily)